MRLTKKREQYIRNAERAKNYKCQVCGCDTRDPDELLAEIDALRKVVEAARECLWVDECQCDEAYTGRGRHEPNKKCGELDPIREALRELDGEEK